MYGGTFNVLSRLYVIALFLLSFTIYMYTLTQFVHTLGPMGHVQIENKQ